MLAHNWGLCTQVPGLPAIGQNCRLRSWLVRGAGPRCRVALPPGGLACKAIPNTATSFNSSITKQAATGISDTTRSPAHFHRHRRRLRNRQYQLTAGHPRHTSTTSHSQLRRPEVPPSQWSVYRLPKLESLDYLLTFRRVKTSRVWEVATMARMTRTRRFATDNHPSSSTPTLLTMLS